MKSGRTTTYPRFECLDCGKRVHRASYRATCQACGGRLRSVRVVPTGSGTRGAARRSG